MVFPLTLSPCGRYPRLLVFSPLFSSSQNSKKDTIQRFFCIRRSMGLLFVEQLEGEGVFKCRLCRVDAASKDAIISRDFFGRTGRAYLFDHVVNISLGPNEDRLLLTGLHTVNDIYCSCCQQILGWRYEKAYDESQKYKEGKFILERARMWKEG